MKLTLDRLDLRPEFREISCSQTRFEHFKQSVQWAIADVGRATFWEYNHDNYNAVHPPSGEKKDE